MTTFVATRRACSAPRVRGSVVGFIATGGVMSMILTSLACGQGTTDKRYEMAIASGRAIEWVRQMDRLFPSTDHSISYFTGESGKPRWISKVGVHGRYVLIGETEVAFNEDRTKITTHSNPRFHLIEITKITEDPKTGQVLIENGETEAEFGLDEWKKLVEKNGDFASIGVKVVKDKPVLLFDKHWKKAG